MTSEMPVSELEIGAAEIQLEDEEPMVPPLTRRRWVLFLRIDPMNNVMVHGYNCFFIDIVVNSFISWESKTMLHL